MQSHCPVPCFAPSLDSGEVALGEPPVPMDARLQVSTRHKQKSKETVGEKNGNRGVSSGMQCSNDSHDTGLTFRCVSKPSRCKVLLLLSPERVKPGSQGIGRRARAEATASVFRSALLGNEVLLTQLFGIWRQGQSRTCLGCIVHSTVLRT